MTDRPASTLVVTIDPDKLLTLDECVDVFGLDKSTYHKAAKEGRLPASARRGVETRVRADDARMFTLAWHAGNPITTR